MYASIVVEDHLHHLVDHAQKVHTKNMSLLIISNNLCVNIVVGKLHIQYQAHVLKALIRTMNLLDKIARAR